MTSPIFIEENAMPLTSKAHLAAVKTALDELPPPLHVRATCKGCPHPAECKAKPCLNDIARPSLEANAFSRLMLPAQARAFEDALRAGKSLRMITGGLRQYGPAIASILKFRSHCAAYPLWGKQMKALAAANALANNKLKGTPHRHTTHCKKGHELPGEPNWTHPPSAGNLAGTRYIRCMVCFNENQRRGRVPGEEVIGRVMVRLLLKRPINSFTKGGEPGYLLSHKNFTAIRKAFPEIDRLTRENMKDVNSRAQQERHRTDESEHTQAAAKKAKKPARAVEVTCEAIDKAVPPRSDQRHMGCGEGRTGHDRHSKRVRKEVRRQP
jgi:hypothetical protein